MPTPTESSAARPARDRRSIWAVRLRIAVAVAAAGILVLFPFDWLQQVWPAYRQVFDVVFATALTHHLGHAVIFFIAGLLALLAFPALRARPLRYLGVMALGALGEETLQSLFKRQLPTLGDGRDLLFDLAGFTAAYLVMRAWQSLSRRAR